MAANSPAKDRAPGAIAHAIITTKTDMANRSRVLQVRFFMLPSGWLKILRSGDR